MLGKPTLTSGPIKYWGEHKVVARTRSIEFNTLFAANERGIHGSSWKDATVVAPFSHVVEWDCRTLAHQRQLDAEGGNNFVQPFLDDRSTTL